jgi:hypothetical protein
VGQEGVMTEAVNIGADKADVMAQRLAAKQIREGRMTKQQASVVKQEAAAHRQNASRAV